MSLYFYDTEFLEGTQTRRFMGIPFGKTLPTIDLISIGIVDETGREYYAVSKDFNLKEAWNRCDIKPNMDYKPSFGGGLDGHYNPMFIKDYWIRENVLFQIWVELFCQDANISPETILEYMTGTANDYPEFTYKNLKRLIKKYGKPRGQIAFEVVNFIHGYNDIGDWIGTIDEYYQHMIKTEPKDKPTLYGWYSAYDHVALCWLFGKMIDLPKGFPMYTRDLKQMLDERIEKVYLYSNQVDEYARGRNLEWWLSELKKHPDYPENPQEHNALSDARWNKQLYEFLQKI